MKKHTQTQPPPLPKENTPQATNVPPSTSWAEKVKISDSSTRFKLDPISRRSPGGKLCITEEMLSNTSEQWNRCMVGFIPGFKMSHRMVNTIASRVWRSCGLENVTTMSNGFMLFRFKTEAEMQDVMERGPWLFGGKAIVLQQWHPGFKFDKNKISKLPVWIRLHGLPFPLWSQEGLSIAASMVGRPLSCDAQTYNCQRLEFARLCVEIDATLPKVTSFEVTQAPSQHDSTTVGKIVRSKEIPSLIGTESKFTALVKFGHGIEECHSSKPASLGSHTLLHTATDETGDESSASAMPEQDHDSWNTRGLNSSQKIIAVRNWISNSQLSIVGILKTKASLNNLPKMEGKLNLIGWNFISNATSQDRCRILVGWNSLEYSISCIHSSPQWITCEATSLATSSTIRITFVYGFNTYVERKPLWDYLATSSHQFSSLPWTLLGPTFLSSIPGNEFHVDQWSDWAEEYPKQIGLGSREQLPSSGVAGLNGQISAS
ncbi:hypothetical protein OIU78_007929 [Salix suchowensis]|nr:hypothetical protein OIU78_007929 [Salix suchowensis]